MPRKTAASRKGGLSRPVKKDVAVEEVQAEPEPTPKKGSNSKESGEGERSRRSSTAAQTAASVAESRVTRTRTSRQDSSSPTDSRRGSGKDVEAPAARVRSSRRGAGRINYKESDGEEEASTPKNEDNFDSNDEFDDSDSDEKSKPKGKRGAKPVSKPRAVVRQKKGKGKVGGRGRPAKRKARSDDEEEEEEQEAIDISDDSVEWNVQKKSKIESHPDDKAATGTKKSRGTTKTESAEKSGRKSSRSVSSRASKAESPVSKRPSRNKQVKKYTEVDEDFDEEDEEAANSDNEEKAIQPEKKETSRKRKRDVECEPNKRPKREPEQDTSQDNDSSDDLSANDSKVPEKSNEKAEVESSDEAMDVDDSVSDSDNEKGVKEKKPSGGDEKHQSSSDTPHTTDKIKKPLGSGDSSSPTKGENCQSEPNHVEKSEEKPNVSSQYETAKTRSLSPEKKDNAPGVIKSLEKEHLSHNMADERKGDNKMTQKQCSPDQENTFLSKDQMSSTAVNGEGEKTRDVNMLDNKEKAFHFQNSTAPKANGETDHISSQKASIYSGREYIANDFAHGLKGNTVPVGLASYNLSSAAVQKDKLLAEMDKDGSVICLQNVSKSLFHDVLEPHYEANGFKAAVSWPADSDVGLVTFYKSAIFRLHKVMETSFQKLVQKRLESSDLGDNEKAIIAEYFDQCGSVLFTQLEVCHEENTTLTVANVKIPLTTVNSQAMQVVCLNHELASISEKNPKRILLCGEFNVADTELPYQLLRHGRPSEQILDEFKSRIDSMQGAAIAKFLKNISHNPSVKLSSCYAAALGREVTNPETKTTSPDLLWVSADGIHTIGIVDLPLNYSERLDKGQVPLKADLAVTLMFPPKAPV